MHRKFFLSLIALLVTSAALSLALVAHSVVRKQSQLQSRPPARAICRCSILMANPKANAH